ncbi:hypothetical protein JQC92_02590 [Shewanella sp. 202IG2-18]|uniref:hypothetical protein n=1 Tax=Parashewanella hymeniacidonis TaxID=2807618 RepID=UPI00196092D3|nr:hypothetical protein [Parashewanella hymeniacidonis]MBM7070930.1 hypothetical protein [Parashewanella hymeniacidonis]
MTKDEAIKLMESGEKLTHESFTSNEWVKGLGNGMLQFEDGCLCPSGEFWFTRKDEWWLTGWSIFEG